MMNLKNKKILITGRLEVLEILVEKILQLGAVVLATGTNEEKLNNLKKKFPNIQLKNLN